MEWLPRKIILLMVTAAFVALNSSLSPSTAEMAGSSAGAHQQSSTTQPDENFEIHSSAQQETAAQRAVNGSYNDHSEQDEKNCRAETASDNRSRSTRIEPQSSEINHIEESSSAAWNSWWEFDILQQSKEDLVDIIEQLFAHYKFCEKFDIPDTTLRNFIVAVQEHMPDNPYHNFHHVASVVHFSFLTLSVCDGADRYLTDRDVFIVLFSALIHDLNHPGNDNAFEVKSQSQLALKYNNVSVLENYSIDSAFELMDEDMALNVFQNFVGDDLEYIKNSVRDAVLYTDMSKHFELLNKVGHLADKVPVNRTMIEEDEAARQLLIKFIVHVSDISNPGLPFELHSPWSHRISDEFSQQVNKERQRGLEVTAMMDGMDNEFTKASAQVGFIRTFALPCFEIMALLFPGTSSILKDCVHNANIWQGIVDHLSI
eukprot:CAMPEP_0116021348 /NCGR_PEP_ID=MMETSP0321-20121206/10336_1 /TAXON_ID=163516 /ORGANISM="Leptocylindrus danicus var. danicus, Strain B650" /LENGTH=428 /DNA_ID=CAMNT_0003492207 /DNA_START=113 /DNA_END=1399 /DNA_ORIENTATION=+